MARSDSANKPCRGGLNNAEGIVVALGSGFFGSMLVVSAVLKVRDPSETLRTLSYASAKIFGENHSNLIPIISMSVVVFVEVVLGISLVTRVAVRKVLLITALLFAGFTGFMLWLVLQEAPVGCGCGFGGEAASMSDVVRGLVLFTACCGVIVVRDRASRAFLSQRQLEKY